MQSLEEKRVYGDRTGAAEAYVGCGAGVLRVSIAETGVGEFGLWQRCRARDVATSADAVAIATDEDVLVRRFRRGSDGRTVTGRDEADVEETGFGPAVAVSVHQGALVAASPDGRIARWAADAGEWVRIAHTGDLDVRALDGDLAATDDGVYRVEEDGVRHAGLEDVRDVSVPGIPLAATGTALYALGNGWIDARRGAFDVVAADPASDPGRLERAHAVAGETLYEHAAGEWLEVQTGLEGDDRIVDVAYGVGTYAVTEGGRLLIREDEEDGWRSNHLGVEDVRAIEVRRR